MDPLKMYLLLKMAILHCYVSLPEGNVSVLNQQFSSTSFSTKKGFGDTDRVHHVMLLPDGRILAKYYYGDDYMECHAGSSSWESSKRSTPPIPYRPWDWYIYLP